MFPTIVFASFNSLVNNVKPYIIMSTVSVWKKRDTHDSDYLLSLVITCIQIYAVHATMN